MKSDQTKAVFTYGELLGLLDELHEIHHCMTNSPSVHDDVAEAVEHSMQLIRHRIYRMNARHRRERNVANRAWRKRFLAERRVPYGT